MTAQKLQLKIYTESGGQIPLETFIPVFHTWIRDGLLPELMIDVANYAHVPQGPGVVLIGHAYDYFIDEGQNRRGLLHNRKRAEASSAPLEDLFRRAIHAALLLEKDPSVSGLKFDSTDWLVRVNDRLAGPNSPAALAAFQAELKAFASPLFAGGQVTITPESAGDKRQLLTVRIRVTGGPSLPALLERLGGPPVKTAG